MRSVAGKVLDEDIGCVGFEGDAIFEESAKSLVSGISEEMFTITICDRRVLDNDIVRL